MGGIGGMVRGTIASDSAAMLASGSEGAASGALKNASGGLDVGANGARTQSYGNGASASTSPGTGAAGSSGRGVAFADATDTPVNAPFSVWDTSITDAGSRFLNVETNLTAQEFEQNLISNGYSIASKGTNTNGPFTVLTNGPSTYTTYIRSSTGESGAFFKGPGGVKGKYSFVAP